MHHIVYKTTCLITGRYYIGLHSTNNLSDGYLGSGVLIRRSIKKYGKRQHRFEVLQELPTREEAARREKILVEEVLGKDALLLNIGPGGDGGNKVVWSDDRRAKQSRLMASMPRTQSHCDSIRSSLLGARLTETRKQRISSSLMGHTTTEQTRQKLRDTRLGKSDFVWTILAPTGEVVTAKSLQSFCLGRGFKYLSLYKSLGRAPISRGPARGWQVLSRCQK